MKKQLTTAEIREQLSQEVRDTLRDYLLKKAPETIREKGIDITMDFYINGFIEDIAEYPGEYPEDDVREWADRQVHIYFSDLWDCAKIFSEYTEQAINEYGALDEVFQSRGLTGLFAQGELYFWEQFAHEILTITNKI